MKRKQIAAVVLGMMMAVSVSACAGRGQVKPESTRITQSAQSVSDIDSEKISSVKEVDASEDGQIIGMPNPFTDHDSLKEAQQDAGFEVQAPEEIQGGKAALFRNLRTEMLEIIYLDGEEETARVRKGTGVEDISGDYNVYPDVKTVEMGEKSVTIKGEQDGYLLAVWKDGEYVYSVNVAEPLTQEETKVLVEQIQ